LYQRFMKSESASAGDLRKSDLLAPLGALASDLESAGVIPARPLDLSDFGQGSGSIDVSWTRIASSPWQTPTPRHVPSWRASFRGSPLRLSPSLPPSTSATTRSRPTSGWPRKAPRALPSSAPLTLRPATSCAPSRRQQQRAPLPCRPPRRPTPTSFRSGKKYQRSLNLRSRSPGLRPSRRLHHRHRSPAPRAPLQSPSNLRFRKSLRAFLHPRSLALTFCQRVRPW
jgi:hypothetical protein